MVTGFRLTEELLRARAKDDGERDGWFAALPGVVASVADDWGLDLGDPYEPGGYTAWVAPARRRGSEEPFALKVGWKHTEAEHEAEVLRRWNGTGAVRLHASSEPRPDTVALLLEECVPGTILRHRPEPEQDEVIASVLRRVWVDVEGEAGRPNVLRPLQVMCDQWAEEFEEKLRAGRAAKTLAALRPTDIDLGLELWRALPSSAPRTVLLCTDLHAGNVLAAQREPWLLIDPKPYVGDPYYDILQHVGNTFGRLEADAEGLMRRMCDLTGLDDLDRAMKWLFARLVIESPSWPGGSLAARLAADLR